RHLPQRKFRPKSHGVRAEPLGVEPHHKKERQEIEGGGDGRHPDHVEVADLQELGDQEGGGAQDRRRDDGAEAARREQPAGRVLLETRLFASKDRRRRRSSPWWLRPSPTAPRAEKMTAPPCGRRCWPCGP